MNYHIKSLCHQGAIRENNEDAIQYGVNDVLGISWMIVADGMGGHNAGEVASNLLTEHISQAITQTVSTDSPNWTQWIIKELNTANVKILQAAQQNIEQQGMGTTGVLMICDGKECHIGWVGDSRAYSQKNKQLTQETLDHTMLQELVNKGAITAEMAKNSNTKNLLSQAIGVREEISVDTVSVSINNGDIMMLSTDGIHDYLSEEEINQYLLSFTHHNSPCDDMVEQAITNNSRDNLTIGLISFTQ